MFHLWVLEIFDYFQNNKKYFGKSSNKGLVVFAKSRLDGKPANSVRQLTLSGREFSRLFDLFEFLYHTYGIKDLYSYYERKFDGIAPCKDVLSWSNRAAISKFLSKLPIWTQREPTKLRFNNDDYNGILCELDDFFCRNYVSRQLLTGSKRTQTSNLDDAKSNNSSDSKSGHKNQADNPPVASSKAKEKGSAQFINQKLGLKEELRELDRREGRCYYCHQKGHLNNLCKKKIVAEGSISNLECSARTTNDDVIKIFEASSTSSSGSEN
ncbi:hypothetical protein GcC1_067020b [Golovinomyces cichoracearum]|uniref:CCHC-type domain-containing protein n=1 Tax=Golovinomyces cichoracearum TaxID=62708 RepID=A0A420IR56_9PEZI|nr:hypothetical protein GcC1_067020b [Golovinomyces cichoracearum]